MLTSLTDVGCVSMYNMLAGLRDMQEVLLHLDPDDRVTCYCICQLVFAAASPADEVLLPAQSNM